MRVPTCPLCDSTETASSFSGRGDSNELLNSQMKASGNSSGGRNIFRCKTCDVYFCHPLPSAGDLLEAYDGESDEAFVSQNEFRYKTFKDSFVKFMDTLSLSYESISVTDIGAAGGVFLRVLKDLGIRARGVEASAWLAEYGRINYSVDLVQGNVKDFIPSSEVLDIVTYWDVLEHLSEPRTDLELLSSKLNPNSLVLVSLPSTDSFSFKALGWKWPMHLDVHLFYFNEKSLEHLFNSQGFSLVYRAKYPQTLSLGYLLFRSLLVIFPFLPPDRLAFLTRGVLNSVPIKYSIGQRVFAFQKR